MPLSGDIVKQLRTECDMRAAVVRVAYQPRTKTKQERRILILRELSAPNEPKPPVPPTFFAASWTNWARVPALAPGWGDADPNHADVLCMTLTPELISELNIVSSVCHIHA